MADPNKRWTQKDKEDFSRGARQGGSLKGAPDSPFNALGDFVSSIFAKRKAARPEREKARERTVQEAKEEEAENE